MVVTCKYHYPVNKPVLPNASVHKSGVQLQESMVLIQMKHYRAKPSARLQAIQPSAVWWYLALAGYIDI